MSKLKKGDKIKIILGKDRGKEGVIDRVLGKEEKVFVAGLNLYKRHVRKQGQIEGGIIDLVRPMNLSNVELICPNCKKATRIGFSITGKTKTRVCRKCHKNI